MWTNLQRDILEEFVAFVPTYYSWNDLTDETDGGWQYAGLLVPNYKPPPVGLRAKPVFGFRSITEAAKAFGCSRASVRVKLENKPPRKLSETPAAIRARAWRKARHESVP